MSTIMSISIIIPIYNAGDYIGACIDSVFSQECDEADLECILVNDCTPDNSMEIVNNKLNSYNGDIHFKVIHLDKNSGHCAARNAGVRVSKGKYLLFLDSDDMLKPNVIKLFIEAIKNNGGNDVDVVMGNAFFNVHKLRMHFDKDTPFLIDNSDEAALRMLLSKKLIHTSWNKLVKRSVFTEQQLYFHEGIINEDILWSYLLFRRMKNLVIIPDVTYLYNENNPINITNTTPQRSKQIIKSRITILNTILDNPPQFRESRIDYYSYILFFITRATDIFEQNKKLVSDYLENMQSLKTRFLKDVWSNRLYLLWFFSLIIVKPFYYLIHLRLYRRYFWKIQEIIVSLQKAFIGSTDPQIKKALIINNNA